MEDIRRIRRACSSLFIQKNQPMRGAIIEKKHRRFIRKERKQIRNLAHTSETIPRKLFVCADQVCSFLVKIIGSLLSHSQHETGVPEGSAVKVNVGVVFLGLLFALIRG